MLIFWSDIRSTGAPPLAPSYGRTRRRAQRPAQSWRSRSRCRPSWTIAPWSQWMTSRNCLSAWTVSAVINNPLSNIYFIDIFPFACRAYTASSTRLFWPTFVFPPAHGQAHWQGNTAGHHGHVLWQKQAARRILVQCAQKSVSQSIRSSWWNWAVTTPPLICSVDELYRFINTWVKHLYGELDEEQIKARGFELIQEDTEWTKSGTTKAGGYGGSQDGEEISDLTRESWEVSAIFIQLIPPYIIYLQSRFICSKSI